jgi:hypothetical protein
MEAIRPLDVHHVMEALAAEGAKDLPIMVTENPCVVDEYVDRLAMIFGRERSHAGVVRHVEFSTTTDLFAAASACSSAASSGCRQVAMMMSPRAAYCLVNSSPSPRSAPVTGTVAA